MDTKDTSHMKKKEKMYEVYVNLIRLFIYSDSRHFT